MRNATPEEMQKYTVYTLVVSFKNLSGKNKNVTFEKVKGDSVEEVKQRVLSQAKERFPLGADFFVKDCEDSFDDESGIYWRWKELPSDEFWEQMDKQLAPFNAEVVEYPYGDYAWFVGPKIAV